jgi:predicted permease
MAWARFLHRRRWDRERSREVEGYLEIETAENLARGMSPGEARDAARRKLGNTTLIREEIYRMNTLGIVEAMWQDLRYAGRLLRKAPGFTAAVIAILALGIGANTVIFSIVNAVLLRPLPFPDSGRLVRLFHVPPQQQFPGVKLFSVSPANYIDWKAQSRSFDAMAAYQVRTHNLTGGDRPETVRVVHAGAGFFDVVGVRPAMGRIFTAAEDAPGRDNIAVISDAYWRSHLGGGADVLGRAIEFDHRAYTVIGVMPPAIDHRSWGAAHSDLWVPLAWDAAERAVRDNHNYNVAARLGRGVDLKHAGAELEAISAHLAAEYPAADAGWGATIVTLQELVVGDVRTSLLVLLGAVGFVLLIACANVANLVLARSLGRQKEIALRTALGAGRGRVLRQMLVETTLLAAAGGAAGLLLARVGLRLLSSLIASQVPRAEEITLDPSVLLFTLALSVVTGIAAGLLPALRAGHSDLNDALKQGSGRTESHAGGSRARNLLVAAEVALSLMLLIGAGLMIRTLLALQRVNPGFDPHGVLTLTLAIPKETYATPARRTEFFDDVARRVRALPAVDSAGYIDTRPITDGGGSMQPIALEGRAAGTLAEQPEVAVRQSSPGYFRAMRIPLLAGRDFVEGDSRVLMVSQSMAQRFWPGQNPLGARMRFTLVPEEKDNWWEVVGVVGDIKEDGLSAGVPRAMVYQWTRERSWTYLNLAARSTTGEARALAEPIREIVRQIDAEQPVRNISTMEGIVDGSLSGERFNLQLLSGFASIAVMLAAVGIYSLLS